MYCFALCVFAVIMIIVVPPQVFSIWSRMTVGLWSALMVVDLLRVAYCHIILQQRLCMPSLTIVIVSTLSFLVLSENVQLITNVKS